MLGVGAWIARDTHRFRPSVDEGVGDVKAAARRGDTL
jgi:hypothetical protein